MRRFLIACALVVGVGCTTDTNLTIAINNNVAPAGLCEVDPESSIFATRGFIDAQADEGYLFTPVVVNYADSTLASSTAQRVVFAEGAEVDLTFADGLFAEGELDPLLSSFTVRFSGSIEPDGGRTAFIFPIIPVEVLEALAGKLADDGSQTTQVRADVRVFGTMAGSTVETEPFVYWVEVCDGCLKNVIGACNDLPDEFSAREGGSCNPLQDGGVVDCCTVAGQGDVCPATLAL